MGPRRSALWSQCFVSVGPSVRSGTWSQIRSNVESGLAEGFFEFYLDGRLLICLWEQLQLMRNFDTHVKTSFKTIAR